MLQSMREMAHSWVVKSLMLFLAVSFSLWGIGDIFRGNPLQKTVASIGHKKITVQDLNRAFDQTLSVARQRLAPDLTAQQAKQMGLLDKTLDDEVNRNLLDQETKALGLDVPSKAMLDLVAEQKQFRTKDGAFNKEMFLQLLRQQGMSERDFLDKGRQDLARQILLSALGAENPAPQTVLDALYRARARQRVLDIVTIDSDKIGGIPTPDDKILHDFYDHNSPLFTAPEYREVTVATLSIDTLMKDIIISDDRLHTEYDAKRAQLAKPEQRDIVQVVVQDEDKAKQLAAQARSSHDLTATAKINKETAVPLDGMEEQNMLPELAKIVFVLSAGGVSDPVKTQLGWHVMQVARIIPASTQSFDSAKDGLRTAMQRDQAIDAATRLINQLDDQLAAGHSLDDVADELKLRLVKIPAIDANGLKPDGKEPAEFPDKDHLLKAAFAQGAGETSPVESDKDGNYDVIRTDAVTVATTKPFDIVKDDVAKAWKIHEQADKAQSQADQAEKALREGKPLSSFTGQEAISTRQSPPLSELTVSQTSDASLPRDLVARALKLKKGETTSTQDGNRQIIARVASIVDVEPDAKDPRRNMIALEISRTISNERVDQYTNHLRNVFTVTTDRDRLDAMRQQDTGQ